MLVNDMLFEDILENRCDTIKQSLKKLNVLTIGNHIADIWTQMDSSTIQSCFEHTGLFEGI